ncbi:MAG: hypothetical protein MUE95_02835 [Cyclobacteriaceae bacterium]|jgi:hypothetical protein|nr:hypothetical protein [Cyclobacteriaceae bacterium]
MITEARKRYNEFFTEEKYQQFLQALNNHYKSPVNFRVAETPVFIGRSFKHKLIEASDEIIAFLLRDDFKKLTERSIPEKLRVPGEDNHPLFLALDFAVVKNIEGELMPQLIEMQGFPSLFGWQDFLSNQYRTHFPVPDNLHPHFDLSSEAYRTLLRRVLLNGHDPENVILLEIEPYKQNTSIDFVVTREYTGIEPVHIGDLKRAGKKLFYIRNGKDIPVERIYNRVIFDELSNRRDLQLEFNLTEPVAVEWAGHPNWFFRISKYTMPFIRSRYVPECRFLSDYTSFPDDLQHYVLKPLFSFSGTGIKFHLTRDDLKEIPPAEYGNFLLQRKVNYEPVIQAPDGLVKTEIRLLFIWENGQSRPRLVTNLARLSRGEMIGVKFNKNKTWVGGSVVFFEED